MSSLLDRINKQNDIKKIHRDEYKTLAMEIRRFLITQVSRTGGHLASNLGVVELTMALHLFLDLPQDKLVWDVGHQAYVHKLLTGRKKEFATLRQFEGMSGFPKRKESECDAFDTGHSSTSISAACGLVKARELRGTFEKVIAVIGDGALSGGMAFEALNNAGRLKSNLIIMLNDNNMSISENVGGMSNYLGKVRTNIKYTGFKGELETALKKLPGIGEEIVKRLKRSKDSIKHLIIPGMLFEDMGVTYIGPIDGHNIELVSEALNSASRVNGAVIIHAITKKGKGYIRAEKQPSTYHGVEPFDIQTGKSLREKAGKTYTEVFSDVMVELGKKEEKLVAITAAMPTGTGLEAFRENFPDRFFDVGIAEEHAVTFAAGLAAGGYHPVVAVYSTFLQRAYDQILHDVCLGKFPVVFAVDRAGIVGNDGETHQGIFDISYMSHIPGLVCMAPKNKMEFIKMISFAVKGEEPTAVRYPRGLAFEGLEEFDLPLEKGKGEVLYPEGEIAIFAVGSMVQKAVEVRGAFLQEDIQVSVVNVRFIRPFDTELIKQAAERCDLLVTMEENVKSGGFGEAVSAFLCEQGLRNVRHINISLRDVFLEHGDPEILKLRAGLDTNSMFLHIKEICREERLLYSDSISE